MWPFSKKGASKPLVDWGFSCGRAYLTVNGYVVAMEGDVLRDFELGEKAKELSMKKWGEHYKDAPDILRQIVSDKAWTDDLIKFVAEKANDGVLPK